jgi:hypothetical protein
MHNVAVEIRIRIHKLPTYVTIAGYPIASYVIPGTSTFAIAQSLVVNAAMGGVVGSTWATRYPSSLVLGLMCTLRGLQVIYHLVTNPVFLVKGSEDATSTALEAILMRSIYFSWSVTSPDHFLWFFDELQELARDAGEDGGRHIELHINVTRANAEDQIHVHELIAETPLEGCVTFSRLDVNGSLRNICDTVVASVNEAAVVPSINVLFCGSPIMAADVKSTLMRMAKEDKYQKMTLCYGGETVFG